MTAISSQSKTLEQEQNEQTDKQLTKQEKISNLLESSKKFQDDIKQSVSFEPNVPQLVLFPDNWWWKFEDLKSEQMSVYNKTLEEATEYATKNFKYRETKESDPNDETRSWGVTTYRGVKLPNTTFPDLQREIRLSSKNAVNEINAKLQEAALKRDGDILLEICKKQGKTQYQTKWEVEIKP